MENQTTITAADGSTLIVRTLIHDGELHVFLHRPGTENGLGRVLTGYITSARKD